MGFCTLKKFLAYPSFVKIYKEHELNQSSSASRFTKSLHDISFKMIHMTVHDEFNFNWIWLATVHSKISQWILLYQWSGYTYTHAAIRIKL
jgi:hypothetical protein